MVPYLNSIHQTLYSWRSGRNADGWKLSVEELLDSHTEDDHDTSGDSEAPAKVQAVPRLKDDLFALGKLSERDKPYKVPVCVKRNGWVGYGMGDGGCIW